MLVHADSRGQERAAAEAEAGTTAAAADAATRESEIAVAAATIHEAPTAALAKAEATKTKNRAEEMAELNTLTYSSSACFHQGFRMNSFDSFKAARRGQRPMTVDMGLMTSTCNSTLVRKHIFPLSVPRAT